MEFDSYAEEAATSLRRRHSALFSAVTSTKIHSSPALEESILDVLRVRLETTHEVVSQSIKQATGAAERAAGLLASWIDQQALIRFIGLDVGRSAALIPMRRLSLEGARVHLDDGTLPTPHLLHGGGAIAVLIGDEAHKVARRLVHVRRTNRDLQILGVTAVEQPEDIAEYCDVLISLSSAIEMATYGHLNDLETHAVTQVLDILTLFAMATLGRAASRTESGSEKPISIDLANKTSSLS